MLLEHSLPYPIIVLSPDEASSEGKHKNDSPAAGTVIPAEYGAVGDSLE
jgi:hypothetical protein